MTRMSGDAVTGHALFCCSDRVNFGCSCRRTKMFAPEISLLVRSVKSQGFSKVAEIIAA